MNLQSWIILFLLVCGLPLATLFGMMLMSMFVTSARADRRMEAAHREIEERGTP